MKVSLVLDGKRIEVEPPKGIRVHPQGFQCEACGQVYQPTSKARLDCPHNCNVPGLQGLALPNA
jgi:hypothetical protein